MKNLKILCKIYKNYVKLKNIMKNLIILCKIKKYYVKLKKINYC